MIAMFRRARRTTSNDSRLSSLTQSLLLPLVLALSLLGSAAQAQVDVTASAGTPAASYPTLKDAFDAVNAGTHQGVITMGISADTAETAPAVLNASGAGAAVYTTIGISPTGGAPRTISGAIAAGSPLIDLNGADNVTIDGLNTGGNSLTIANTTASATSGTVTIRFIGGATNNVITNSNIQGSSSSSVATNGGTFFFSTDAATANGNDNNTISNNNIGPAGANLPSKALLCNGSTTTTAIGNSGNIVNNNNVFDYFAAALTSAGMATNAGCNTWTITNNRFYQTATRTWTTGALHTPINIQNTTATSGAQGFTITGNIVGFASNTQTGTYTLTGSTGKFVGILYNGINAGPLSTVSSNTVSAVSLTGVTSSGTGTASPFIGILLQTGLLASNSNTIGSQSATGALTYSTTTTTATDVYGMYNFSSAASWTANNNNIGGMSVTNLGASGTFNLQGIRADMVAATIGTATGNTVGGTIANSMQLASTGAASQVIGMLAITGSANWTSNTVRNLTNNNGTGTAAGASVIGLSSTTTGANHTFSQNTISGLTNTNTTVGTVVTGIQFTGGTANVVQRNLIHGLTTASNSTAAEINGIRVAGGTTSYRNNMIAVGAGTANAIGTGSTTGGINGIFEATGTNNFFHNSVYVGGAPTAGVGPSYAFASNQVTVVRSNRDNVYFNARSNAGATGKNYALRVAGTTPNPAGLTLNNNVYFANGTGAVFGFFNALDVANLAAWKVAVGQDAASIEGNPAYNDPNNATPDLHLHPTNATVAEGNGFDLGVTDDFDGQTRSGLTPVDIGADAGNFNGVDLAPPAITYTALGNTTSTGNRTLTATMIDVTGVATGGLAPRIYYRKNADAYFSQACSLASGTVNNGTWTCVINSADMGGVVTPDVISYFVIAQDTVGNIGSNPSGATATDVNTVTVPPAAPNTYKIAVPISGVKTVCAAGCDYATLTGAAGAFSTINGNVLTGNTELQIAGDLIVGEDGSNGLNVWTEEPAASNFTLRIYPTGVARAITGAFNGALVRMNGASRVTIDGSIGGVGTDRSLTISNTSVTSPTVVVFGSVGATPVTNDTLKNCVIINGITTSSAVVISDAAVVGNAGFFSNITIQNNDVQRAFVGVFATGGTTPQGGSNLIYTENTVNTSGAFATRRVGLYMQGVNGATVTNNSVGNLNPADGENDTGIWLATGSTNVVVSGNTVTNLGMSLTTGFAPFGLLESSGLAVSGNSFVGNTVTNLSTTGSTGLRGIAVNSGGVTVANNRIQGIQNNNTGTFGAFGIDVQAGNNAVIRNNFISDVNHNMTGGAAFGPDFGVIGIRLGAGTGHQVYYNSVNLFGPHTGTAATQLVSAAFSISTTAQTGIDVRNNIFANNITGGTTGIAHVSVFLPSAGTAAMNLTWNNNAYFFGTDAARQGVGQAGTTSGVNFFTTLPALAAYSSTLSGAGTNDNASLASTGAVPFTTATDLHLLPATTPISAAVPIAGVTTDIDGDPRPVTTPDIGADEIVAGILAFSSSTYSDSESIGTTTITVTRTGGSTGSVSIDYATVAGGNATGGAVCGGAVDFVNASGTLTFIDSDVSESFTVTICPDSVNELNETVNLALSNPLGGAVLGTPSTAVLTINDDDLAPTISITDVTQAELNSGTSLFGFVVSLSATSGQTVTVHYETNDGSATVANNDYVDIPDTILTFLPGETIKNVDVTVNGDTAPESNENFFVDLSTASNASILDNQGVGTITNDDASSGPVTVTATAGTPGPTDYATLKLAFDAINAGTHQGAISIEIVTSVVETATAALNASGSGAAVYTSVVVRPSNPGVSVTGSIVGAIIKLNGADNVTIDGRVGGIGTARSLTVQNTNTAAATAAIWLSSNGVGAGSTNNVIRNLELATGPDQASASTAATFGIIMSGAAITTTSNGDDNDNNQFIFNRIVRARYGIVTRGVTTNLNIAPIVTDNIVGPSTFGANQIGKVGIFMQADTGATVSRNVVQSVGCLDPQLCTGADRVGIAIGVESWAMTLTTITSNTYTVTHNVIHDVVDELTFSAVGVLSGTTGGGLATNNLVANNFIYNVRANGTAGDQAVGIGIAGGHTDQVVNNSIAMTGDVDPGASTATTNFGSGIRIGIASSANHANLTLRNNSVYMDLSSSSTAATRYYAISGAAAAYDFGTGGENFNNYYINPANPQLQTGGLGTASGNTLTTQFATLANWQAAYTIPQDANSLQANPNYFSTTSDLHITGASANIDTGTVIAAVTVDIDNEARPNGAGYDIGADEYYPAPGVLQLSSATYVGSEGGTIAATVSRVGGSAGIVGATYTLTDGSATGGAACTAGVDYINPGPQLLSFGDNVTSQPINVTLCSDLGNDPGETFTITLSTPTGGATLGSPTAATATITNIAPPFNGTVTVGTGGTYPSLTNPGGIFEAINTSGVGGNTTIDIVSDIAGETGVIPLNEAAGGFTITIKPSGAPRIISGSSATQLIKLSGADNVTIDGSLAAGTDRSLTITNAAIGPLVWIGTNATSGANNNTIKNTNLIGPGAFTGQGIIAGSGATLGGAAEFPNSNNTIQNNSIKSVQNAAFISGNVASFDQNWTITGNTFGSTVVGEKLAFRGMLLGGAANFTISNNIIAGVNSGPASTATMSGIQLSALLNGGTVTGNRISDVKHNNAATATSGTNGIFLAATSAASNVLVANNFISDIASPGTTGVLFSSNGYGIAVATGGGYNIIHNSVLMNTNQGVNAATANSAAVVLAAALPNASVNLRNNVLANIQSLGTRFAVIDNSTAAVFSTIDFNDYFAQNVGSLGGTQTTLANWQAATGQDVNSLAVDPLFVTSPAPADLHLQVTSPVQNEGTPVATVTVDIDNGPRSLTTPEIGADELADADLAITKTDGVGNVIPGGNTTYTIVASNAGPLGVTGATVADTIPVFLTCNWTCSGAAGGTCAAAGSGNINDSTVNLPAGGSVTYILSCAVSAGASGSIANTATVSSATADPNAANNSATDTNTVGTPSADLSITKTDGSATEIPGTTVVYTIVAANAGPSPAPSATVADTFTGTLSGCSTTCVGSAGGTCTAGPVVGNLNDTAVVLPVGGSVTYTATCTISSTATGSLANTATVASATADPNSGNNSATDTDTLNPSANVGITKTDGSTTATAGQPVVYTIVASNAGPSAASTVTVADTFVASLTGCSTTVAYGGGASGAAGPFAGNLSTNANLPVGGTATYTATCTLSPSATGTLVNTATATVGGGATDPTPANNTATDTDTVLPLIIFIDGFESGNTGQWSLSFPLTFNEYAAITVGAGSSEVGFDYDLAAVEAGRALVPNPIAVLTDASGAALVSIVARRTNASGQLELSLEVAGSGSSSWVNAGEIAQQVRLEWTAAGQSNLGHVAVYLDGRLALWIDGFAPAGSPAAVKLMRSPNAE